MRVKKFSTRVKIFFGVLCLRDRELLNLKLVIA